MLKDKICPNTTQPAVNAWSILPHVLPGIRAQWRRLCMAAICLVMGVVLRLVEPWPLQLVLDSILGTIALNPQVALVTDLFSKQFALNDVMSLLTLCAVSLILIAIVRAWVDYYRTVTFSLMGNHVISDLRSQLFRHLQSLSLDFHQRSRGGDLTVRLTGDINMLKDVAVSAALPLISSGLLLVGMLGIMLWMNWRLGMLVLAVFPLFALVTYRSSFKIHQSAQKQRRREGALAATAAESLAVVKSLQAHGANTAIAGSFATANKKSHKEGARTSRLTAGLERAVDIQIAIATALVLWQGTRFVLEGSLTAGELVVYLAYLKRGFKPLQDFAKYTGRISKAMAAGERISEILNERPDVVEATDAITAPTLQGRITFENISFCYQDRPNTPILNGLSLEIPAGAHVAIVGPSGIGKSTLLSLLLRLRDPNRGQVLIDGCDTRRWTIKSLRDQIGVILQENGILAASVRDNIALANPQATLEQIVEAAKIASADEFIQKLPDGYDTVLGERSVDLSHGQSQRLAIARAALRNSPILLLDEPTSSLDAESRARVVAALNRVTAGKTTLMVTHDMELASQADRILYLGRNHVVEFGTHAELMQADRDYAQLMRAGQSPAALWESVADAH